MPKLIHVLTFLILINCFVQVACASVGERKFSRDGQNTLASDLSAEENKIYSLLIDRIALNDRELGIVISEQTVTYALPFSSLEESTTNLKERLTVNISNEGFEN